MKTFRYLNQDYAPSTMTVKELRDKLAEYPDDLPVFAEWEGCLGFIGPAHFAVEKQENGAEPFDALVIDVNEYWC